MISSVLVYKTTKIKARAISLLGLYLLIITSIYNTSQFGASLSWIFIPCLLIVGGGILNISANASAKSLWIFLLWFVYLISTVTSEYVNIERNIATFFIFCLVYVISTSQSYTKKEIHSIITLYIIVATTCALNIIYHWLIGDYYVAYFYRSSFKFLGVYKDPNYSMAFIVPGAFMALIRSFKAITLKKRILYISSFGLCLWANVSTASRSALLSLAMSVLIMFIFFRTSIAKKVRIICVCMLAVLLVFYVAITYLPTQSIERFFNLTSDDTREELWRSAIKVFYKYPILGGGFGSANTVSWASAGNASHNVFLDILCDSGIVGAIIFSTFFITNCFKCKKNNRYILYGLIVAFMLPMFFINGFNTATFYLPLIILSILSQYLANYDCDII